MATPPESSEEEEDSDNVPARYVLDSVPLSSLPLITCCRPSRGSRSAKERAEARKLDEEIDNLLDGEGPEDTPHEDEEDEVDDMLMVEEDD